MAAETLAVAVPREDRAVDEDGLNRKRLQEVLRLHTPMVFADAPHRFQQCASCASSGVDAPWPCSTATAAGISVSSSFWDAFYAAREAMRPSYGEPRQPEDEPVGAVRVFPEWQDEHHETHLAIRWTADMDESHPWLLLDSEGPGGPQRLGHDNVRRCQSRPPVSPP